MSDMYILNDRGEPVPEPDVRAWGAWFETARRQLVVEEIGPFLVSTVFLGLSHQFGKGPPLVFETMVFHRPARYVRIFGRKRRIRVSADQFGMRRSSTRAEAIIDHAEIAAEVRSAVFGHLHHGRRSRRNPGRTSWGQQRA